MFTSFNRVTDIDYVPAPAPTTHATETDYYIWLSYSTPRRSKFISPCSLKAPTCARYIYLPTAHNRTPDNRGGGRKARPVKNGARRAPGWKFVQLMGPRVGVQAGKSVRPKLGPAGHAGKLSSQVSTPGRKEAGSVKATRFRRSSGPNESG